MHPQSVVLSQGYVADMSRLAVSTLQVDFRHPAETDLEIKDWLKNAGHPVDTR